MAKNSNLHAAKVAKNDEFYTMLTDIEKEMSYYKDFFKGKVVYCNCDDARESNFFKYFSKNFEFLGLKKLITTGYKAEGKGVVLIYEGDKNGNRKVEDSEIVVRQLEGSGDFRSEECIEFLKEADVVVTNPPFSLFREYVKQLMDYGKKFIIMANSNAITYKEFFPYIKNGQVWLGRTLFTGKMPFFKVKEDYCLQNDRYERRADGLYKQVNSICWFTNVPNDLGKINLPLYKDWDRYSNEYPKYDNYDAIEVGRIADFPIGYEGVAGVPITALKYLNSDGYLHLDENGKDIQFEIVGNEYSENIEKGRTYVNGKRMYSRIFIKKVSA